MLFLLRSVVTMASFMSAPHTSLQSCGSGSAVATVAGRGKKQVWNKSSRVTPADLPPPPDINTSGLPAQQAQLAQANTESLQEELKTKIMQSSASKQHLQSAGRKIEWPRGSIPRTVKKLSWDDESEKDRDREVPIFMDVDVSLTPSINTTRIQGDPVHLQ